MSSQPPGRSNTNPLRRGKAPCTTCRRKKQSCLGYNVGETDCRSGLLPRITRSRACSNCRERKRRCTHVEGTTLRASPACQRCRTKRTRCHHTQQTNGETCLEDEAHTASPSTLQSSSDAISARGVSVGALKMDSRQSLDEASFNSMLTEPLFSPGQSPQSGISSISSQPLSPGSRDPLPSSDGHAKNADTDTALPYRPLEPPEMHLPQFSLTTSPMSIARSSPSARAFRWIAPKSEPEKTVRFVEVDSGSYQIVDDEGAYLSATHDDGGKRHRVSRGKACEECRRRKTRCVHSNALCD